MQGTPCFSNVQHDNCMIMQFPIVQKFHQIFIVLLTISTADLLFWKRRKHFHLPTISKCPGSQISMLFHLYLTTNNSCLQKLHPKKWQLPSIVQKCERVTRRDLYDRRKKTMTSCFLCTKHTDYSVTLPIYSTASLRMARRIDWLFFFVRTKLRRGPKHFPPLNI